MQPADRSQLLLEFNRQPPPCLRSTPITRTCSKPCRTARRPSSWHANCSRTAGETPSSACTSPPLTKRRRPGLRRDPARGPLWSARVADPRRCGGLPFQPCSAERRESTAGPRHVGGACADPAPTAGLEERDTDRRPGQGDRRASPRGTTTRHRRSIRKGDSARRPRASGHLRVRSVMTARVLCRWGSVRPVRCAAASCTVAAGARSGR